MTSLAAILYGTTAELPLFLQTLMGYPALQSGYALVAARRGGVFHDVVASGGLWEKSGMRWMLLFGFS